MKTPQCIIDREEELLKLVSENPIWISVDKMAEYLHKDIATLKSSIRVGNFPGGRCGEKTAKGYTSYFIETLAYFYNVTGKKI